MKALRLCVSAVFFVSASANSVPIELQFVAEISSVAPISPPGVPSVGDTIVGSLVYESDTPPTSSSPGLTIKSFGRDAVLEGSFSISSPSLGGYHHGSLVTDNADPRVQNIILHNAGGTGPWTDEFIVASGLGGDTLGFDRFEGDPLTYLPHTFRLTIFETTTAALADGFIEDVRVLPTGISFGPDDGSFGFINLDWQQEGGARWFLFAPLTSVSAQPLVTVAVSEPASLALLLFGFLVAISSARRLRR